MNTKSFILSVLGLAGALVWAGAAEVVRNRPNVLIVINDDQSWLECSAYGNSSVPTPQFDRVARQGVLFTQGYTSAPSCAPSRASLLTGRYFWELEQGAFIQAWLPAKFATVPEILETNGYRAGYTGKGWGPGVKEPTGKRADPAGKVWNSAKLAEPPEGISSIDYVRNFELFLERTPAGKPFYFWVGLQEPHDPHGRDNFRKLGVGLDAIKLPAFMPDTPGVRRQRANYLYEVRHADGSLGRLLQVLESRQLLTNTLVIVTADNGTPVPHGKCNIYDWGVRVPLAIMWPERIPAGRKVTDFVNFSDLAPTILEAAAIPVPAQMSGRSVLPVLFSGKSGRVDPVRDHTVAGLEWHGELPPCTQAARMIRNERYLYITNYGRGPRFELTAPEQPDSRFAQDAETMSLGVLLGAHRNHPQIKPFLPLLQAPRPAEELYDCLVDPDQTNNLATDSRLATVKQELYSWLQGIQRATGDPRVTRDMTVFEEALKFVQKRKEAGYSDTGAPAKSTKPRRATP